MTDEELLQLAKEYQSFNPGSGKWNEYNGLDTLSVGDIKDDRMYALVHDGNLGDLTAGKASGIEYFFDQATYDKYVEPTTGKFDAKALSEALQVKPFQNAEMAMTDGHAEYRYSIACFERKGEVRTPVGICEANTQFGGGGAHEAFIPADESIELQNNGILVFNADASNIHTGTNYSICAEEYEKIQSASDDRCQNCEEKGINHPEPEACMRGFAPNPSINGTAFNATGIIDSKVDGKEPCREPLKEGIVEQTQSDQGTQLGSETNDKHVEYAQVEEVEVSIEEEAPPNLHDLNSFLIEASEKLGITAAEVADCLQHIYEEGDATYPRTDSNCITSDMENTVASILSDTGNNS